MIMGPNLTLTVDQPDEKKGLQIIHFDGNFDKAGHSEIRDQLDEIVLNFSLRTLIFDLKDLKFINSEGIGYLMEIHTHLVQRDKQLVLVKPNAHVADVFKTIGIAEIIPVHENMSQFENK